MEKYSSFLRSLLEKRGITNLAQAEIFLNPDYERDLHDPFLMRDMEKACTRLFEAIQREEKIIIYADYDCDGVPGAVILHDLFKKINYKNYDVYIPQRNSEGYGLNLAAVKQLAQSGARLMITVDLGITAVAEVQVANEFGIDVIITDHHLAPAVLPPAYAILNPKVDNYPDKMLCGAGVAFKFVQGFLKKYREIFKIKEGVEKWLLDMAGMATLADMVPIQGENRALVHFGLKVLRKSPRPGFQKLLAKVRIDQRYLGEEDLGFMIVPRLNAASRMGDPRHAFELLATEDGAEAGALVDHLTKINDERKKIVTQIMREVNKKLESPEPKEVIVVGNPDWRVGVLGLVAGKICDKYKRPVFVWSKDENNFLKGSCRSDGSVSVVELMREVPEHFLGFGGHEFSGGFTLLVEKIELLETTLVESFKKIRKNKMSEIEFRKFDLKIDLNMVNLENWQEIEKLGPFGLDNPRPIFLMENLNIEKVKKFGKNGSGEHLEIIVSQGPQGESLDYPRTLLGGTKSIKAISFFADLDSFKKVPVEGLSINLLATIELSRFLGRPELRLKIVDIF
jgi:single-stranded-DNA-specific exonuclease